MSEEHDSQSIEAGQSPRPATRTALRSMTAIGAGLVAAGVLTLVVATYPRPYHGATESVRLQWEQRQQMVDDAVMSQRQGESPGTEFAE
jgi:hypothetical protein